MEMEYGKSVVEDLYTEKRNGVLGLDLDGRRGKKRWMMVVQMMDLQRGCGRKWDKMAEDGMVSCRME